MAEFIRARASHLYAYDGGQRQLLLPGWLLTAPVQRSWETRRASFDYVGRRYGEEVSQGNARMTLAYDVCIRRESIAELERDLLLMERELNLHPHGTLLVKEAYAGGNPLLVTQWEAHIATASTRGPLPGDEAPPMPGAWGTLTVELILTNPQEL